MGENCLSYINMPDSTFLVSFNQIDTVENTIKSIVYHTIFKYNFWY